MIDPIARFGLLLERAIEAELPEPTAMALATATPDGVPSVRIVLLKRYGQDGFVFYTNLESRKALDLLANPRAALCFHWHPLQAQVRVEGNVLAVSDDEADAYFESRPRGSQVGAWASLQSRPLTSADELEARVAEIIARFEGIPIPRPPFWSGFLLVPDRIEFWSGRLDRLHEREVFRRDPATGAWEFQMLYP
jgi:pyridoxamine 5'-phosphate oxidase